MKRSASSRECIASRMGRHQAICFPDTLTLNPERPRGERKAERKTERRRNIRRRKIIRGARRRECRNLGERREIK